MCEFKITFRATTNSTGTRVRAVRVVYVGGKIHGIAGGQIRNKWLARVFIMRVIYLEIKKRETKEKQARRAAISASVRRNARPRAYLAPENERLVPIV